MATSTAGIDDDNFVLELNRVKKQVQAHFMELRKHMSDRENMLIQELNDILSLYTSYKEEVEKRMSEKRDIENRINTNKHMTIYSTKSSTLRENLLNQLNEELNQIQIPVLPDLVTFVCEPPHTFFTELSKFGKLKKAKDSIDYSRKTHPIISVCTRGDGDDQLNYPRGVAVDPYTGNIYVTDQSNNCIKVFDSLARYLTKFGHLDGKGKMNYPRCLAIGGSRVFITQGVSSILTYQLDGKFIYKIGVFGDGDLEFNYPWGLTINENTRDLYICDLNNNRVQILSENFQYKSQFGKEILTKPRDITLTTEKLFVLDASNPCLHIFGKDLLLQTNVIKTGVGPRQLIDPHYFFVDRFGNILVSDCGSNSILIFNSEFKFRHQIAVSDSPMEVTMDTVGRIIVVCQATGVDNCLQVF